MVKMKNRNDFKKALIISMAIIISAVIGYFTIFEGTHMEHNCTGRGCPVCHELKIAEGVLKELSGAVFMTAAFGALIAAFVLYTGTMKQLSITRRTLVSDRVRMDN